MAESNGIRFLLFVSLMIFPAQALKVILANSNRNFWYKTDIIVGERDNSRVYIRRANERVFPVKRDITKVILYVVDAARFSEIMAPEFDEARLKVAKDLGDKHYELLYLEVEDFKHQDEHIIREFIYDSVKCMRIRKDFSINTIGDISLETTYVTPSLSTETCFEYYIEDPGVCSGELEKSLSSIKKTTLRELFNNKDY